MWAYILKRLLLMIPTLLGVMLVTFTVTQFVPGGPVEQLIYQMQHDSSVQGMGEATGARQRVYRGNAGLDDEKLQELKALYGFDKPAYQRFIDLISSYARFDFGDSFFYQRSVIGLIISKMPVSISLGMWTFFIVYLSCIPLGISKAVRDGSTFDVASSTVILVGYAIPGFVLGVFLVVLFGGGSFWDVFPLRGLTSDNWVTLGWFDKVKDYLWHMVLPVISLVVSSFAVMTMLTKNSFLEEIRKQYVVTARSKGLSEKQVLYKHIFRNAMIPLITGFPSAFIMSFFAGSILIEQIFSLDGIGLLMYESILKRDYPVVLGELYIITLLGLVAKLITDLCYVVIDPRIQFESVGK